MKTNFPSLTMVLLAALAIPVKGQTARKAIPGYSVSVFTMGVSGKYTAPDSG